MAQPVDCGHSTEEEFSNAPDSVGVNIQDAGGQVGFDSGQRHRVLQGAQVVIVTLKVVRPSLPRLNTLNHLLVRH